MGKWIDKVEDTIWKAAVNVWKWFIEGLSKAHGQQPYDSRPQDKQDQDKH